MFFSSLNLLVSTVGSAMLPTWLKLAHRRSYEAVVLSMAGSAFRRALRLFPPPIVSSFLVALLVHLGLFSFDYSVLPKAARHPTRPERLSSFGAQLAQWASFAGNELVNPWEWGTPRLEYGPHLWTILVSFKGSMFTFLTSMALLRVRANMTRLALLAVTIACTLSRGRWDMALFLCGQLLCELDFRRGLSSPPRDAGCSNNQEDGFDLPITKPEYERTPLQKSLRKAPDITCAHCIAVILCGYLH